MRMILAALLVAFAISTQAAEPRALAGTPWPALSAKERDGLAKYLSRAKKGSITVSCASKDCLALAQGVEAEFTKAGWKVAKVHHGGLGIDGVVGIRIDSCGTEAVSLKKAVEEATDRKPHVVDEGPCGDGATREVYVTIGAFEEED